MGNDLQKHMTIEKHRKSTGVAYLLWLLLGWFGVHRIYSGKTGTGIAMLILAMTGVGLVVGIPWWLVDAFLIPGMVRERNLEVVQMVAGEQLSAAPLAREPEGEDIPEKVRRPMTDADRKRQEMLEDLRQTGYKKERRDRVF